MRFARNYRLIETMYWQDEKKESQRYVVPDDVVDISYDIRCRTLPVDHAYALRQGLRHACPWLEQEEGVGVHSIHVAESGNGWMRPENAADLLHLSRRTKLVLRIPKHRLADAGQLSGQQLDVAGHSLDVGKSSVRPLSPLTTVFARYVVVEDDGDEDAFMQSTAQLLQALHIQPKKMLCGLGRAIRTPEKLIRTRSLMLADMDREDSVKLQQQGLGLWRQLGCGLFIPHKDLHEVGQKQE